MEKQTPDENEKRFEMANSKVKETVRSFVDSAVEFREICNKKGYDDIVFNYFIEMHMTGLLCNISPSEKVASFLLARIKNNFLEFMGINQTRLAERFDSPSYIG